MGFMPMMVRSTSNTPKRDDFNVVIKNAMKSNNI